MAYNSGFFDAVDQGSGNYDRVYNAADFAHYFSLLVKNGVFPDPSSGLQVKASTTPNMQVSVLPGSGWINGYYITVSSAEALTVPTAHASLSRIDSIIMGLDYSDRQIKLYIKSGAASASPIPPTLQRNSDKYELELARITLAAGTASISQTIITDMRANTTRCGIVSGTVNQIDTTDLFAQYDSAFQSWFSGIQSQLSGNVAANLQAQITQNKSVAVELTLTTSGWINKEQTLNNVAFETNNYKYLVGPVYASDAEYNRCKIKAKDVTEAGKLTFVCTVVPSTALTVQVLKVRV